jgi:hypothetical protein
MEREVVYWVMQPRKGYFYLGTKSLPRTQKDCKISGHGTNVLFFLDVTKEMNA